MWKMPELCHCEGTVHETGPFLALQLKELMGGWGTVQDEGGLEKSLRTQERSTVKCRTLMTSLFPQQSHLLTR